MNHPSDSLWARTRLHVWPERYRLVSLPAEAMAELADLIGSRLTGFFCLLRERDELSVTVAEEAWRGAALRRLARGEAGPYRVVTLDLDVDLDVTGYLAPAADALARAGVAIVPQCAFLKDHLLVREEDLGPAVGALERLVREAGGGVPKRGR